MNIVFAYPWVFIGALICATFVWWWRRRSQRLVLYQFPLIRYFAQHSQNTSIRHWQALVTVLRSMCLFLLVLATARPRIPDEKSKVSMEGIATMLVLDVSGSMDCFDDIKQPKSRFMIAQEEAIKFIERRASDLFGIVLFGAVAASRCPLTADKRMVTNIIRDTKLGVINPEGTVLAVALAMAVNRLRSSTAASKIIVLLTDGTPSPEDMDAQLAIDLAGKAGIKVYTIGIGSDQGGYVYHPLGGMVQVPTPLNSGLLMRIAQKTGGQFFRASNQKELAAIYEYIDKLETTAHDVPVYTTYYELAIPVIMLALFLVCVDIGLAAWRWVTI